ncbi:hypothetical protein [Bacillus wiedmannii]|uniref:hypothetical protein n=1 Tax=Bacillus wiedmannii TaxID=1890302 RepID=UPI000BF75D79|nr:hypothetical protein [Bacillus wiedmannii]PGC72632.1 hypothetical protein COM25_22850 [Bacillus wiedmannii]
MCELSRLTKLDDVITSEKLCNGSISANVTRDGTLINSKLACNAITVDRLNIKLARNSITVDGISYGRLK